MVGIIIKQPVQLRGTEGALAHDPLDRGVRLFLQEFPPQQPGKEARIEVQQPLQVLTVLFADVLTQLGVPAPPRLKVLQGDQIV